MRRRAEEQRDFNLRDFNLRDLKTLYSASTPKEAHRGKSKITKDKITDRNRKLSSES